jgi:GDPmannose 4,6-dehydratase
MKKVLITGPLGQDGILLTKLLQNDYKLYGACKLNTDVEIVNNHKKLYDIELLLSELSSFDYVKNLIATIQPNIIVNFAGETDVINPWQDTQKTFQQNFVIPANILNVINDLNLDTFFFQASSSLMYGRSDQKIINENSNYKPMYPYGITKLSSHLLLNEYRHKFKLKGSSGIFFNHESFYRSDKFVSKKLSKLVANILRKNHKKIKLYDLNFYRDISHANDFMKGVKIIIDNQINDDFIFSSNVKTNLFDFSKKFFELHNLNFYDYIDYIDSNNYTNEYSIIGDNKKLKSIGWSPDYNIDSLIFDMVNKELEL